MRQVNGVAPGATAVGNGTHCQKETKSFSVCVYGTKENSGTWIYITFKQETLSWLSSVLY